MPPASSPTWAPSFARGLSSAQDFLGAQALPPPLAWSHCPSDWLPILWFVALSPLFSYASDALFFTRSLYRYHALGAFFSPSTVSRTLGPWP